MLSSDYLKSLLVLEACCEVDNKIDSFTKAFQKLLNGASFNEIQGLLKKVFRFKKLIENKAYLSYFKVNLTSFIDNNSILKKRLN